MSRGKNGRGWMSSVVVICIWISIGLISLGLEVESQDGKQFHLKVRNEKPIQSAASGAAGSGTTGPQAAPVNPAKRPRTFIVEFKKDAQSLALAGATAWSRHDNENESEPKRLVHERVLEHVKSLENLPRDFSFEVWAPVSIIVLRNPSENIVKDIKDFPEVKAVFEVIYGKPFEISMSF